MNNGNNSNNNNKNIVNNRNASFEAKQLVDRVIKTNMQQMEHNLKKSMPNDATKVQSFMNSTKSFLDKELKKTFKQYGFHGR